MDEGKERELKEEWKVIEDYPDYSISNLGRVKSLKFNKERILKQCKSTKGFYFVKLRINKRIVSKQVHKLILEAFDHISISSDSKIYCKNKKNSINNLEWIDNGIK